MSGARADVLATVRRAIAGHPGADAEACARRLDAPKANIVPERGRGSGAELLTRFVTEAEAAAATVARVPSPDAVPDAIAAFLDDHGLLITLKAAPVLKALPWPKRTSVSVAFGAAEATDAVGVSEARYGIAETGTLMVVGGPHAPTGLNFLPDTHIVVLEAARIVGAYEDAWAGWRAECGGRARMPRAINWITGPSRSADIELVVLLGVHGPRRLHIVLIDGQDA